MLISPTERDLRDVGSYSTIPERWGCDVLMVVKRNEQSEWVGVQRKAIPDLIASVHDGRLTREMGQMDACARLGTKVLLIEGEARWTTEGTLMTNGFGASWSRAQHMGLLWSVRARGVWVDWTRDIADTKMWLRMFEAWVGKARHQSLERRPSARGAWGKPDSREFGIHVYQSFTGVGPELAGRMWDQLGGLRLGWSVSEEEMMKVQGIGKKRARELMSALNPTGTTST